MSASSSPSSPRRRSPSPSRSPSGAPPSTQPTSTTSTVLNHTIPQFYACYLLRSFNKVRGGTYIGSTPDPPKRFRQHSGDIKGGAVKTQRGRPWEMEAIVYGFPSKLQALQFEWAWQNPHASRHLRAPPSSFLTTTISHTIPTSLDPPTAQFPRSTLSNRPLTKIQVLQFMLTVPPWRSFRLRVMLFSSDAKSWWDEARRLGPVARTEAEVRKWVKEREKEGKGGEDAWGERGKVIDVTEVGLRREGVDGRRLVKSGEREEEEETAERIRVDDHDFFDPHWARWSSIIETSSTQTCTICKKSITVEDHLSFLLCISPPDSTPTPCLSLFHLSCLASRFLSSPPSPSSPSLPSAAPPGTAAAPLVPTHGPCPGCGEELHWTELVRGAYRRKEEEEGRRKKRRFQKGSREKAIAGAGVGVGSGRGKKAKEGGSSPVKKKSKAAVGAGRKKKLVAEEASDSEGAERFDFNDEDEEDDLGAGSVDLRALEEEEDEENEEDAAMEEQERSWAQLEAAEGGGEFDFDFDGAAAEEDDGVLDDFCSRSSPPRARRPVSPRPPPPVSPKKRGRPPKKAVPLPPSPSPRPPPRRTASSSAATTAAKKRALTSLTSAFTASKSSLSAAASKPKSKAARIVYAPLSDSDNDLPLPSTVGMLGARKGGGKEAETEEGKGRKKKKKVEYVELSD